MKIKKSDVFSMVIPKKTSDLKWVVESQEIVLV